MIAEDPSIQIVVEVMGGIEPAYTFVKKCLMAGKSVVTSNKALVAKHGAELLSIAREKNINFLFEASVGGGIPIIRPLNSSMTADEIEEITGILNGTTNYMLSKMFYEGADYEEVLKEAQEIQKLCKKYHVPFVINDNVKIAKEMDADGVHVGQSDMEADDVRKILGEDKILGVSAQTVEQAVLAEKMGADYLGVGAVFSTLTKKDASAISKERVKAICEAVHIPVIAIGGITADNILTLKGSGICGIAVVSAIFAAKDIEDATGVLLEKTTAMVNDKERH